MLPGEATKRIVLSLAAVIFVLIAVIATFKRDYAWVAMSSAIAAALFGISWFAKKKLVDAAAKATSTAVDLTG